MKKSEKKKKQFEVEFRSMTYRFYNVKAENAQIAKLIAFEDMKNDDDSSWHWRHGAELSECIELGKNDDLPF